MKNFEDFFIKEKTLYIVLGTSYIIKEGGNVISSPKYSEIIGHCRRVSQMAKYIAPRLGYSSDEINLIKKGALYHDCGKFFIDDAILLKSVPLTEEEFKEIKKHPQYGYRYLKNKGVDNKIILDIVLLHHERIDGAGYPFGLKGNEIPDYVKLVSILDAYDAMITQRCYKQPVDKEEALRELQSNFAKQFCPTIGKVVIDALLKFNLL